MIYIPDADVFNEIEVYVAESGITRESFLVRSDDGDITIDVATARTVVLDRARMDVRDAVWASLIRHMRERAEPWQTAAIWLMTPSLRAIARRLSRIRPADSSDIRSEVILGFLEALHRTDPTRQNIGASLWWAAFRRGRRACQGLGRELASERIDVIAERRRALGDSTLQPTVSAHAGVLAVRADASPARHRTEGERLGSLARRLGLHEDFAA